MTVASTNSRVSFAGDGVTVALPVSFYFQQSADLIVKLYDTATGTVTDQTLTTHYTISTATDADFGWPNGATVTMVTAAPTGTNVVIYRDPAALQELQIPTSGQLPSKPIEAQLDLTTMQVQRVKDVAERSVALPDGFGGTFDPALPSTVALSPGSSLVINSAGTGFDLGPDTTQIAAAAAAAAAASTYAWYGSNGGTSNALTLTPATALTSYATGQRFAFLATTTNTTAATLNISALGVKTIVRQTGTALAAGDITSGRVYTVTYDGTNFAIQELTSLEDASIVNAKLADAAVSRNKLDTSTTQNAKQFDNVTMGISFASNAATISAFSKAGTSCSATDYANISFRSATLGSGVFVTRKLSAALSTVISSGSTGGFTSAVSGRLHIALIDNAGTLELAWCGTQLFDESALITTTAEGGAGGADSRTTIYSTTARSNVACRYIGFMDLTQATAGTWVTAPSKIMVTGAMPYPKRKVLHLTTGNGHGSSGTFVRRLTTTVENSGADVWTYTDSSTAGMSVTILEEGWYKGSASDLRSTNTPEVSITKNASNLAVGPTTLTNGTILGTAMAPTNTWAHVSWSDYLYVGDVIRMQDTAGNDDTTVRTIFRMMKVG